MDDKSVHCGECGAAFRCGAATGRCWCMDLPRLTPMPVDGASGSCLCEKCLKLRQGKVLTSSTGDCPIIRTS